MDNLIVTPAQAGKLAVVQLNNVSINLCWCPAGQVQIGCSSNDTYATAAEKPSFIFELDEGFWIGQTPITQEQWFAVMGQNPDVFRNGINLPAIMDWYSADEFCRKLTFLLKEQNLLSNNRRIDLPSEAYWEYACRAGTESTWYFGDNITDLVSYGWYRENSENTRHSVGQKMPNVWNIYDLYGNVAEWCANNFDRYPLTMTTVQAETENTIKSVRGGDFGSFPEECRSASRQLMGIDNPFNEAVGLRIICTKTH